MNRLLAVVAWISTAILAGCGGGNSASSSPPPPPAASLSYPSSPLVFDVGTAITPVVATASQGLSSFTITPSLSSGLSLNSSNGTLSGTPTAVAPATTYMVTASGGGASASASESITVNPQPPSAASYGVAAVTFTTNVPARTITPTSQGGAVTSWSISPALPAGLTLDATDGAISGTPTTASAPTSYAVTAQNAGGQSTVTLTIEVDSAVLLDVGHDAAMLDLGMRGSNVLSVDRSGHWNLWDYASAAEIASGDLYCAPDCSAPNIALEGVAGGTVALATGAGFEFLSAATGQVLASITAPAGITWWSLASDGSYLVARSNTGLFAWSPAGDSLISLSGDYSKASLFAAPGRIQVANGPAGYNVIQTVAVSGGATTTSAAFNGQFYAWFLDGSQFITSSGGTDLVYSLSGVQQAAFTLPGGTPQVIGDGNWFAIQGLGTGGAAPLNIYAISSPTTPAIQSA